MTRAKHTLGPWHVSYDISRQAILIEAEPLSEIAWLRSDDLGLPNARLIAAAPELLEALIYLEQRVDALNGQRGDGNRLCYICGAADYDATVGVKHLYGCAILVARAAIAKAEAKS